MIHNIIIIIIIIRSIYLWSSIVIVCEYLTKTNL
jgi:hypothetical protein